MAHPGELKSLIEQALRDDDQYQKMKRAVEKAGPGSNKTIIRMMDRRKIQIEEQVRAQNPFASKRGGMIHPFGRGYKTNKF